MNWITKEQAEKAGKGTQLEAAKCSWDRWIYYMQGLVF